MGSNRINLTNINTISTVITGLSISTNYHVKIWAVDDYGNEAAINDIDVYVSPEAVSGGGIVVESRADTIPPIQPILNPIKSPANLTNFTISGLSEPLSRIDLYDNGILIGRLSNTADNSGRFAQNFTFEEGDHPLTARAIDFANNQSGFSQSINLTVDLTPPQAPVVSNYKNNEETFDATPKLIGTSELFAAIEIILDANNIFTTSADNGGIWSFILPSAFSLNEGEHNLEIKAIDLSGNESGRVSLKLNTITPPPAPVVPPTVITPGATGGGGLPAGGGATPTVPTTPTAPAAEQPSQPISSAEAIKEISEATELSNTPIPKVTTVLSGASNNIIKFSGTALPGEEVIVYIHSDQAVIYKTKAGDNGVWSINHSQEIVELAAGEHSVFAVAIDTEAKVKSRPSLVGIFTVKKNFWITLYNLLNLQTTIIAMAILLLTMLWLYRIRRKQAVT